MAGNFFSRYTHLVNSLGDPKQPFTPEVESAEGKDNSPAGSLPTTASPNEPRQGFPVKPFDVSEWTGEDPRAAFRALMAPLPEGISEPQTARDREWDEDFLGSDYQHTTMHLGEDDEGPVEATLVRYRPEGYLRSARAVLYVHGWCDYFFQTETAEFFHGHGASFYAVDLRKYGRSLRKGQTPGYTDSLSVYAQELASSIEIIREELGSHVKIMLVGHSTGGLVCSLWAHHNPGQISGLILNSPWLELQGSSVVRVLATPGLAQLAKVQPKAALPSVDNGFYNRTVNKSVGGEWDINPAWRPTPSFPVRPGWLAAITAGHAEVAKGLNIETPVLVLTSARSAILMRWSDEIRTSDSVLDVEVITRRAVQLGPNVTINRIQDGLHDLALSPHPVRDNYYEAIHKWTNAYGWES